MSKPVFVYTTYIETTAEKLWHALTDGDFTERYWFGHHVASDWNAGSAYRFTNQGKPTSRVTFDLEPRGKIMKLTVTHDELGEDGKTFRDISGGWPLVMASLK